MNAPQSEHRQIYRQAALDRLGSPERLDRPGRLVGGMGWQALALLVAAMCAALVWVATASAPIRISAPGIVLPDGGLVEIVAGTEGQVDTLSLAAGQQVAEGEAVAVFARTDLQRDLENALAELADAQARHAELAAFYAQSDGRNAEAEDDRLATIAQTQSLVERRRTLLEEKIESLQGLIEQRIIVRDRVIDAELDLSNARERLSVLDDETKLIALRRLERQSEQSLALIDEKLKVDQLERQVQRLQARLADEQVVRSAHAGRVVEVRVNRGDVVTAETPLATLAPIGADGSGEPDIFGLLFVPPADGKRITAGMRVELEPSTARREEYGYILGEVTEVSPVPVTNEGMRRALNNDQLVTQFSGSGAPFEVRVRFLRDPATPSGLAWSSSRGPQAPIQSGTLATARIVVDHVPLVSLAAPGLRRWVGDDG
jgi:HlyD family secretion protein